jgi:hypothetical protein
MMAIALWAHLWIFYSIQLVYMSVLCHYHAVSVTMAL